MVRVKIALMVSLSLLTACSTVRTRMSDPVMRIAVDADSIPQGSYVRLQRSLVDSNAFTFVDRAALHAIDKEQRLQHKTNRFGSDEKYAQWGALYGVGGIIIGSQQCEIRNTYGGYHFNRCLENLSLVDVTTGETIAVSEKEVDTDGAIESPDWTQAVNELIQNYPKVFANKDNLHQTTKYSSTLETYRSTISKQQRQPATSSDNMDAEDDTNSIE